MSVLLSVLSAVFWGAIVLSALVFIHEAGHYLAARACGVRVTEFMLGLPCRHRLSFKSKKVGTEIGVTPLLLGGYNRICGMEPVESDKLAEVLACVQAHGRIEYAKVASETGISEVDALEALVCLTDWAAVRPYYNPELGEKRSQKTYPVAFETVARDAALLTEYDRGHDFSKEGATKAGAPRVPGCGAEKFLEAERSHTYVGMGFFRRLAILFAGPLVNVLFAFVVVSGYFMVSGIPVASDEAAIGSVTAGSYAEAAGVCAGDRVLRVGETEVSDWSSMCAALDPYLDSGTDFNLTVEREGAQVELTVDLEDGQPAELLGISSQVVVYHPGPVESAGLALSYGKMVAGYVGELLVPQTAMEVLDQSSSVVGVSVMASEAASSGLLDLLILAASVSMSLGFMNLLPIPPLDGGKILIELIQLVIRRTLSSKVQNYISYVGLAFFLFVFVVVLKNDIVRFVIG